MEKHIKKNLFTSVVFILLCMAVTACTGKKQENESSQYNGTQVTITEREAESAVEAATSAADSVAEAGSAEDIMKWQGTVVFPDWKGYTDDTLAMNGMYSFFGFHGQGSLCIKTAKEITDFRLYVNEVLVDTTEMSSGKTYDVDISSLTRDGDNTIQISGITPGDVPEAVTVCVPYPEVLPGTLEEEGISAETLDLISDLIATDIDHGFTSAQLAVIRNGRLVYENAWGKTNSYLPDGSPNPDSPDVTTDTLYDLASLTKMFSVNYAIQKLVSEDKLSLDARIKDFLGKDFVEETLYVPNEEGKYPEADLETIKDWKSMLTIRDLLRHQGGFPADPRYCAPYLYRDDLEEGEPFPENPLYAGNEPGEKTKKATVEMICRTPLNYEPGTKTLYSDADYMVLGLVVEQVTGEDLNTWLKKTFWAPMGLTHITYNPLQNGFQPDDCAATELNGNTRDNLLEFPGYRTSTIQGEVHDEKAFYSMNGVSGHAGLFGNATDVAKLASVMLCGGYGENRFFSQNVMDLFTAPKVENAGNWGLGWWRQGDGQRVWYFGTQASSDTIGHQGWTGTLFMVDPSRNLAVAYLTNKINSRVTDVEKNANNFNGGWYTASTLGFVPQIMSIGMDSDRDISGQLLDLTADMALSSLKLIPEDVDPSSDHPSVRNAQSKFVLFEHMAEKYRDKPESDTLREQICAAYKKARVPVTEQ